MARPTVAPLPTTDEHSDEDTLVPSDPARRRAAALEVLRRPATSAAAAMSEDEVEAWALAEVRAHRREKAARA